MPLGKEYTYGNSQSMASVWFLKSQGTTPPPPVFDCPASRKGTSAGRRASVSFSLQSSHVPSSAEMRDRSGPRLNYSDQSSVARHKQIMHTFSNRR